MFTVTTFYKFTLLTAQRIGELLREIEKQGRINSVKGLLLIGPEGCNATVAAPAEQMEAFKAYLSSISEFAAIQFKDSRSQKMPFRRFKVDIRQEIVALKNGDGAPDSSEGTYLSPSEWQEIIESEEDVVVLDTRNFYETELGMFDGAVDMHLEKFSEFPEALRKLNLPLDCKVLMYCTGGIRCEKALPAMKRAGYENVFQLEGGIIRYLEEFPNSKFQGECFVFDHRVAVDQELQPSAIYAFCPHCGNPARQEINCTNCGDEAKFCDRCAASPDKQSCSKNCAYHLRRLVSITPAASRAPRTDSLTQ